MGAQHELFKFWSLIDTEKIGEGTYGEVFRGRNATTGQFMAVKKVQIDPGMEGIPSTVLREISLLRDQNHPHIVRLFDVRLTQEYVYLLFEYLDLDLKMLLEKQFVMFSSKKIKYYMFQLMKGLEQCHSTRILHRDIKPANILVDLDNDTLKLADFGLGRSLGAPTRAYTHEVVFLLIYTTYLHRGVLVACIMKV
eukprot:TRINITY_DN61245_c0_g1_i2.p1 TRINITY_DN61245_c0_g1~~TRINITY_DN61245_c0_g1_i2.p1  ORF type:complete len:195 (+),score=16.97 TRINITY_DN61245_c0_g1_i2:143-727(+)